MLLRELLADRSLDLVVRACPEALDRTIRWVHTTELREPASYLSGGELILTTGVWRRRATDSATFVASLVQSDVCGLVYGLPRPRASMPADLFEACQRNGLPLLEASHELPFISISEAVVGRFAQEREAPLHRSLRRNERLIEQLASGRGTDGILSVVASEGLSTWLLGPSGRLLAQAGRATEALDLAAAWRSLAEAEPLPGDLQLPGAAPASAFPLDTLSGIGAYLVVDRRLGELGPEPRAAIDQASAFLALELARLGAARAADRRATRELLELLAAGAPRAVDAAARLRALDLDAEVPLAVLALAPLAGTVEELADALEPFAATLSAVPLAVVDGRVELVAVPADRDPRETGRLLASEAPLPVAVGAGASSSSPDGRRRSLVEARTLADFLARRGQASVAGFGDLGTHELVLGLLDDDVRAAYCQAVLGPLLEHERRRGGNLVQTLDVFFSTGSKWNQTAATLHVHVNTLRHRLERIEQLTGRDLNRTPDRVDLFLALEMHRHTGDRSVH